MLLFDWKTIGHERELLRLERDIAAENIASAYLFTGPHGIGKGTIARTFAGILQCEKKLCRRCAACQQITHDAHPDTLFLQPHDGSIKIDSIRSIGHFLSQKAIAPRKVIIIHQADCMTTEAANALLKNLEEPQQTATFFLTAQNQHELPETVLSRCRHLPFSLPPHDLLLQQLTAQFPGRDTTLLQQILVMALGRPGRAIALLRDPERLRTMHIIFQTIERLLRGEPTHPAFLCIEQHGSEPWFPQAFLESALALARARLLAIPAHDPSARHVLSAIAQIAEALELLRSNTNTRMLLESVVLSLAAVCSHTSSLRSS